MMMMMMVMMMMMMMMISCSLVVNLVSHGKVKALMNQRTSKVPDCDTPLICFMQEHNKILRQLRELKFILIRIKL